MVGASLHGGYELNPCKHDNDPVLSLRATHPREMRGPVPIMNQD